MQPFPIAVFWLLVAEPMLDGVVVQVTERIWRKGAQVLHGLRPRPAFAIGLNFDTRAQNMATSSEPGMAATPRAPTLGHLSLTDRYTGHVGRHCLLGCNAVPLQQCKATHSKSRLLFGETQPIEGQQSAPP